MIKLLEIYLQVKINMQDCTFKELWGVLPTLKKHLKVHNKLFEQVEVVHLRDYIGGLK